VIFGGSPEQAMGERLIRAWGRGYVAAGALSLRATVMAMRNCLLHVGNDTGTIHMAAAAGLKCVGIYSAHDPPGEWYPYGEGHIVLRRQIDCEGCMLQTCIERATECLMSISVDEVYQACAERLESRAVSAGFR
jgi:ADP-heptose:LPS heptosyltransferase